MSSESPTHPDAPRAGGETPDMIDPDVYRRLDSFATGSPESDEHREDVYALLEAFDALRASLLERHRDGERAAESARVWLANPNKSLDVACGLVERMAAMLQPEVGE